MRGNICETLSLLKILVISYLCQVPDFKLQVFFNIFRPHHLILGRPFFIPLLNSLGIMICKILLRRLSSLTQNHEVCSGQTGQTPYINYHVQRHTRYMYVLYRQH